MPYGKPRRRGDFLFPTSVLFFLLTLLVFASPALAQDDNRERMLKLSQEGTEFFKSGEFEEAALKFHAAYEAFPDENLRKNEMIAWFKAGNCEKALPAGEKYLQQAQDITATDKTDVQTVQLECELKTAESKLAFGKLDEADAALDRAQAANPGEKSRARIAELRAKVAKKRQEIAGPEPEEPPPTDDTSIGWMPIAGYTAAGVGVGLLVFDTIFFLNTKGDVDALEPPSSRSDYDERYLPEFNEAVDSYQTIGLPLWIAGGALTAGGASLLVYHYYFRTSGETDTSMSVRPRLGFDRVGVEVELDF